MRKFDRKLLLIYKNTVKSIIMKLSMQIVIDTEYLIISKYATFLLNLQQYKKLCYRYVYKLDIFYSL